MKKLILVVLLLGSLAYATPQPVVINGPYGGALVINIGETYQLGGNDIGGEGNVTYERFSVIPGFYFEGFVSIGFSLLHEENSLWIDFLKGGFLDVKDENGNLVYAVDFPYSISFKLSLPDLTPVKVVSYEQGGKTEILVNGNPVNVTPDLINYLLPLK